MMLLFIIFIVLVGGGWLLGKSIGNFLFPDNKLPKSNYIDKSTNIVHHHHYHDNRSVYVDGKQFKDLKK